ncbi:MAG TPA: FtsX-like permease family protein [Nocardioidaceae bacterium]|nr:FtsX-like permease family protein [Nocardioidaceae bacterium]
MPLRYLADLTAEGVKIARSQPMASIVAGLMAAGVCVAVLSTTGQTATTEHQVLAGLDAVGSRVIVVSDDTGEARIRPGSVTSIARLSGVRSVVGFGPAFDMTLPAFSRSAAPVPARYVYGALPRQVDVTLGALAPGRGLVGPRGQQRLGLIQPAAGLEDDQGAPWVLAGGLKASGYLRFLNHTIIVRPPLEPRGRLASTAGGDSVASIYVLADSVGDVDALAAGVPHVIQAAAPKYNISKPAALLRARKVVASGLATSSRRLMLLVLAAGLILQSVTMLGAVSQRRRDFGRRRALGASRSAVVWLVLIQTAAVTVPGVLLGSAIGIGIVRYLTGAYPPPSFAAGVALLALLFAVAAAVPPAVTAAFRDPVRILRVP